MKNKFNYFLTIVLLFFNTQTLSNPIEKINFIGLTNTPEKNISDSVSFIIGQNYNSDTSDKLVQSLFKTGFFLDISIEKEANALTITFVENPFIKYLEISSKSDSTFKDWLNAKENLFSNEELEDFAANQGISPGEIYSKNKLYEFVSQIETKYFEEGYYNASIILTDEVDVQNRIGIKIDINQGNQAKVKTLNILGSNLFTEKELLKLFKVGEPDFFLMNYFTNKDKFSDDKFQDGLDKVTEQYFNSGYLDFSITDISTNLSENKENISIDIYVSEGIQYKLGNISFTGDLGNQTINDLSDATNLKTGDIFNRSLIMEDIQTITDIYADQGYAFVNIEPITKDILNTVDLAIAISLNKKIYVNRITISGNTRTQDSVIRREMIITEGGLYSRSDLRESIKNLRRLGYFSDVQMAASEVNDLPDKIDINIQVEETKTGSISLSLSHSNSYGISLGAGIKERNIFGSGNTLNSELKLSESFNKLSLYFENPNYNDKDHSVNFGFYLSELKDDDVMKDSYEISTKGFSFGYGIPITSVTRVNTNIDYSNNTIKCGTAFATSEYELTQCNSNDNEEVKLNINWSENTLNNYMYPTDGRSNSVSLNIATPIGDYKYISLNTNHSSYTPINNNVTLKLTGDLGIAKGYDDKELPFFKRYFGGGSGSVRGFGNKTLGPLYVNGKAKGGELSVFGSANLITPAFFFDNNEKMRLSAFIDVGNVYEKTSNIKLNDLRMSTGVGFAYLSPIGAVGIFASTPLIKKSGDIIEDFGVTLGTGF
jgi:outer membrane protein insertion porin family